MFINTETLQVLSEDQLRKTFKNISFPSDILDEHITEYGFAKVNVDEKPILNWDQDATLGSAKLREGVWVREWTITDRPNSGADYLDEVKNKAHDNIDIQAGDVRNQYVAKGSFVLAEYQDKWEQAEAYLADNTLTETDVPMIFNNIGTSDGSTAIEVANTYITIGSQWKAVNAAIAKTRRIAKDSVTAATSPSEVQTILDNLTW